ncbi:hypothetical protein B0O99DRAFT_611580 [Bisporella sp. PMI_857]|nr:hypothetical protein B0O99DRAFT_611580 [Bisporella sp. PMI_857]
MDIHQQFPQGAHSPLAEDQPRTRQRHVRRSGTRQLTKPKARIACQLCRKRKVRCDFAQRRGPCTNCLVDNSSCLVEDRSPL